MPVRPLLCRGPDWIVRGASFAQDTRWAGVGNWAMSSPISAMMTWAARDPMPGTSSRRSMAEGGPGVISTGLGVHGPLVSGQLFDELVHAGRDPVDLLAQPVDLVEQHPGKLRVMGVEPASQRLA